MSFLFSLDRKAAKTLAMQAASNAHTEKSAENEQSIGKSVAGLYGGPRGKGENALNACSWALVRVVEASHNSGIGQSKGREASGQQRRQEGPLSVRAARQAP